MSALPARRPAASRAVAGSIAAAQWAQIAAAAPQVAATIQRYLQRLAVFLAPASVTAAENALRQFARWMITDAGLEAIAAVRRDDIEDYKVWLAAQPRAGGGTITAETHRQRMRTVRAFFERIIEWDWPEAPARNPVIAGDIPKKPEPLPKFLDDRDAARLMAAARWTGTSSPGSCAGSAARPAFPACTPTGCATRWPPRPSTAACGWRPSPHIKHRKMEMTLIYARIANRVVADEYAAVSAKIDALYGQPPALPAGYETAGMARLRREAHARMLGNGLCTRPAELDCRMESACETCAYFRTGTEFLPILLRQRDHARDHGQADRATLFDGLIQRAGTGSATTERS